MKHTQGDNPMIELRAISEDNFRECLLLRASVENEDFVDPIHWRKHGFTIKTQGRLPYTAMTR